MFHLFLFLIYHLLKLTPLFLLQGDLVIEYSGEVIDITEANRRIIEALGPNALSSITSSRKGFHPLSETYLARFSSQLNLVLDSGTKGNLSRFINHSCEPNLIAECWTVDGYPRLGKLCLNY